MNIKRFTLTLALLALPWTVGAQSAKFYPNGKCLKVYAWRTPDSCCLDSVEIIYDSLYWATRDTLTRARDVLVMDTLWDYTTTYIRTIAALDSVPILMCYTKRGYDYADDNRSIWTIRLACDTTGWRITKEHITERRVK